MKAFLTAARCSVLMALATTGVWASDPPAEDGSLQSIQRELSQLRQRMEELETLRQRVSELEARLQAAQAASQVEAKEAVSEPQQEADKDGIDFVGALRFNYAWRDFDESQKDRRGDVGFDLFRIGAEGRKDNWLISAEYRFYSYMDTIHHGWIGYDFGDAGQAQFGISQVPFGLLPYDSHNYWFGVPYYLGLSDDYDAGLKYIRQKGPWDLALAFYKNAELGDASDLERYSFDPVTVGAARNEEANTVNARLAYTLGRDSDCSHEFGLSGQWGQLHNRDTGDNGHHWALAGHWDNRCGRWNFQLEAGRYGYDPRNPAGVSRDSITLGAFATSYEAAAHGSFGVANIAYNVPLRAGPIQLLTCYNDFSVLHKDEKSFKKSYLNTTGCAFSVGPVFTYVDLIRARNMVFFGDGSLAGGGSDDWETRFNVNVGYYW